MNATSPHCHRRGGFTLIEQLVVVAIILVLAGLVLAAVAAARRSSQRRRALLECQQLLTSLRGYQSDYGFWPATGLASTATVPVSAPLCEILSGRDLTSVRPFCGNPARKGYLLVEVQDRDAQGNLVDIWGNVIQVRFDTDDDSFIPDPFDPAQNIRADVIAWTAGADRQWTNLAGARVNLDNVKTW